jgi:hypothetical protein
LREVLTARHITDAEYQIARCLTDRISARICPSRCHIVPAGIVAATPSPTAE